MSTSKRYFPSQALALLPDSPSPFRLQEFEYENFGVTSNRGFAAAKIRLENTGATVLIVNTHLTANSDCQVMMKAEFKLEQFHRKKEIWQIILCYFFATACSNGS